MASKQVYGEVTLTQTLLPWQTSEAMTTSFPFSLAAKSSHEAYAHSKPGPCLQGVDLTMIHIYPDFMTSAGNLTMQLEFTQQYIQGHVEESQKLNKPLVIGEIGKEPPLADRNTYFTSVFQTAMQSAARGGTLAGGLP